MELFKKVLCLILLVSLFSFPTLFSQTKVLPLGDSITQGQNDGGSKQYNSYRRALWILFQNAGTSVDFIGSQNKNFSNANPPNNDFDWDHEGHWGWKSEQIEANLSGWLVNYTPDVVLIHLGTNDVIRGQSASHSQTKLESIIDKLQADNPNVKVYLAKIAYGKKASWVAGIDALNALIPTIASNKSTPSSPVTVVDINAAINPTIHLYDDAHPNTTGEQVMAQTWYNAVSGAPLPVTLSSFTATETNRKVQLAWTSSRELNSKAFDVEFRASNQEEFETMGQVAAHGNSTFARDYSFQTEELVPASYFFRLKMIDIDGSFDYSKIVEVSVKDELVRAFMLSPNQLTLEILRNSAEQLNLKVFDMLGRSIMQVPLEKNLPQQQVKLDLATGIYQIQLISPRGLILAKRIRVD